MDDWTTTEALLILAGVETFQDQTFAKWLTKEFVAIRGAVRHILG